VDESVCHAEKFPNLFFYIFFGPCFGAYSGMSSGLNGAENGTYPSCLNGRHRVAGRAK
jgi:hypothetical protein